MKVFQERPQVHKFQNAAAFVEEFQIGKGDFILATKTIFEMYFAEACKEATVRFKSDYGNGEPTDQMLDALLADFRKEDCKRIVAIGGGAVLDMAKILVLDTQAEAVDIYKRKVPLRKKYELIAVPTTCGAGSEVSNVSIVELTGEQTKLGLADDSIYADYAVLIPDLLRELPYSFFATSAIDAFIHAIESYVSPKANLYTRMFSQKAMEMILSGFCRIASEGAGIRMELLDEFLTASNLAGIAFGNAGTGTVHAMSYPLSGRYHVAHGESNYQFLTAVFRQYVQADSEGKIKELMRFLAAILNCREEEVFIKLEELLGQIISKKRLREFGMKECEIREFAQSVAENQQRLLGQSYVKFDVDKLEEIYRELY